MFEQSILIAPPTNKSWSFLVSISAELALVLGIAIVPLVFTDHLPQFQWTKTITPPRAAPPEPPRATRDNRPVDALRNSLRVFVAPTHVPNRPAEPDAATPPVTLEPPGPGVQGGVNTGGGTFIDKLIERPPVAARPAAAKAPAAPPAPLKVGGDVQSAKLIKQVIPTYPPLARQARISGTVHLLGIIARSGTIEKLEVVSGHPLLVRAALDAVRQWIYKPTLLNGEPVEVIAPIDVNFTLN